MKTVIIRVVLVFFINYFCPRLLDFRLVQLEERLSDGQTGFDARVQISEPVFYLATVMRTTPSTMFSQGVPPSATTTNKLHFLLPRSLSNLTNLKIDTVASSIATNDDVGQDGNK